MTKPPADLKAPVPNRKKRTGLAITFRMPKSLTLSRYYEAGDERPSEWYGKLAAILDQAGGRITSGKEPIPGVFRHHDVPVTGIDPPRHHLWVNGVEITDELAERLVRMTEEERERFWEEALKGQQWGAAAKKRDKP